MSFSSVLLVLAEDVPHWMRAPGAAVGLGSISIVGGVNSSKAVAHDRSFMSAPAAWELTAT